MLAAQLEKEIQQRDNEMQRDSRTKDRLQKELRQSRGEQDLRSADTKLLRMQVEAGTAENMRLDCINRDLKVSPSQLFLLSLPILTSSHSYSLLLTLPNTSLSLPILHAM